MLCKVYICLDYGCKGVQAFLLTFAAYFLFFYYKKPENLQSENPYETSNRSRPSKMHKWGIPLAAVIGIGVSVPAGTLASMSYGQCSAWHPLTNGYQSTQYSMNLGYLMSTLAVPTFLLFFPLVALFMQVCGAREPKLVPPYSRIAWSLLLFIMVFTLRMPHDVFDLMNMVSNRIGNRGDPYRGMDPRLHTHQTQHILDCLMYLPCILHPLILIIMNADYRQGMRNVWRSLPCNSGSGSRSRTAGSS